MKNILQNFVQFFQAHPALPPPVESRPSILPSDFQPALPVPEGYTREGILESLVSISIDGSSKGELRGYATADLERFLRTLELVPHGPQRILEIGANPYFNTLLLRNFRPEVSLTLTNYFNGEAGLKNQHISFTDFDGKEQDFNVDFHNLNIEEHTFPYADESFDTVVFCEVLEHMTNNPMAALSEIYRVLAPGGTLVLTTPNAARLENVIAFIEGRNIYDPYSAYGPYGRHNREYTRHELHLLMTHCGFAVESSYTANVHHDIPPSVLPLSKFEVLREIPNRHFDLGQYLFTRWRKGPAGEKLLPAWLYRSYPESQMAP